MRKLVATAKTYSAVAIPPDCSGQFRLIARKCLAFLLVWKVAIPPACSGQFRHRDSVPWVKMTEKSQSHLAALVNSDRSKSEPALLDANRVAIPPPDCSGQFRPQ